MQKYHQIPQLLTLTTQDPPYTWSSFNTVTLDDLSALAAKMKPSSCPTDALPTWLFIKVPGF